MKYYNINVRVMLPSILSEEDQEEELQDIKEYIHKSTFVTSVKVEETVNLPDEEGILMEDF